MLKIIDQLLDAGITVELSKAEGEITAYITSGFYKSDGCSYLYKKGDAIVLRCRYNEETVVEDISDIVAESFEWYHLSKDRFSGWQYPDALWAKLYIENGFQ